MTTTDEQPDDSVARDEALVERARRGSGLAFAALVARHREVVHAIARNMCARARDAEEVLQQAFLSAWRDLWSLPPGARFTTWLYGIAMDAALAQRRREQRRPSPSLEGFLPAFDRQGRLVESKGRWSEIDVGSAEPFEITGLLREALDCLDDQARAAFVLRDLVQLLAEEAAVILRTSPQTVRQDAHRARLMLRGFILSQA